MKRKVWSLVLVSLLMIALMMGSFSSGALFSDTATVSGNTIEAGSLVVSVNGKKDGITPFTVENFAPKGQIQKKFMVKNEGTVTGLLATMNGISVSEDGGLDGVGNLGQLVNIRIFIDKNADGWISDGEKVVYNGKIGSLPASLDLENYQLGAGESVCITMIADWWESENDNDGQADKVTINFGFLVKQK